MRASKVENFNVLLKQYLAQTGTIPVPEVLVKNRPKDFMELVIASISNTPALRESSLKSFYEKMLPIAQLIASLPPLETPQQKLAGILLELSVWNQAWSQVWSQVWAQARAHFTVQVMNHVKDPLAQHLRKYNFSKAYRNNTLRPMLDRALGDLLMVYQLGSIPMRHSGAFKQIQNNFADFISRTMTPEEIERVVDSIDIPATPPDPSNYFVQTELNMLRRCLGLDLLPLKFVEQAYIQEL